MCKGGWRRRRLGDCLAYGMYFSIPPSFCCAKIHLPLHKGGFYPPRISNNPTGEHSSPLRSRPIPLQPNLASPLGERWHAKRDGEGNSRRAADCRPYEIIARLRLPPCLPLTREVSPQVTEGEKKSARVVEDADPYKLTARLQQPVGRGLGPAADFAQPHGRQIAAPTVATNPASTESCLAPWGEVAREA